MTSGIRWLSSGPGCGYGDASEAYLSGLRDAGVRVTWTPIGWPSDTWDAPLGPVTDYIGHRLGGAAHLDIANVAIDHDVVVVCSTLLWHDQLAAEASGRLLVAYTSWETDRLLAESVGVLNRYDRVLVPSRFNAAVFKSSGVTAPLCVVPHIARPPAPPADARRKPASSGRFVFYVIATWTTRKAILDAVSAYVTAFTADDDVALVIHTTAEDHVAAARLASLRRSPQRHETATWFTLANALAGRPRTPEIILSTRRLTRAEVDALHVRADCFFCLSRGEGWGLGAFDAAAFGNPVIVTGWGGTLDFLPTGYPYCVDFDLVPSTTDEPDAWWTPRPGEHWAKARTAHAATLLRHVFGHRDEAREWGRVLQSRVTSAFAQPQVTRRLTDALA
jgi:glycosyltransferase involved in cell wall biosynthesis